MIFGKEKKGAVVFLKQVEHYSAPVLDMCSHTLRSYDHPKFPSREFLNRLRGSTTRLEELLDYHGAQLSSLWFPYRESIAAAKLFSTVTYALRHVRGSCKHYHLVDIEFDCRSGMDLILKAMREGLRNISQGILEQAKRCGIAYTESKPVFQPRIDPEFEYR
ncbi:MAG: hypothetical protein P1P77_17885, partial [Spirochaetaceae bacterium]|nr:hypothetical protein [Spirochaetaceae bacterium]